MGINIKKVTSIVLAAVMAASVGFQSGKMDVQAATGLNMSGTTIRGYAYKNSNFPVYDRTDASKKQIGTCYGSEDWIIIYGVGQDGWAEIEYPAGNKTKRGYCRTENLFQNPDFSGDTGLVQGSIKIYKKSDCKSKYGASTKDDRVFIVGSANGNTQFLYPCGGSYYKVGWAEGTYAIENDKVVKRGGNNVQEPTVFKQTDSAWASESYGKGPDGPATIGSSGCGILAYVNAVYYMNHNRSFINPKDLANWSVRNGYRVNGQGTSTGLYKAFADQCGAAYGIRYVRTASSISDIRGDLQNGRVAILGVDGHLIACVAYQNGQYLILDSYPSSSRGTRSGYRWLSAGQFTGRLRIKSINVIGPR